MAQGTRGVMCILSVLGGVALGYMLPGTVVLTLVIVAFPRLAKAVAIMAVLAFLFLFGR